MPKAENGNKIKVHYKGTLEDGTVFDTTEGRGPFEFVMGEDKLIPGFADAVLGMNAGEKKTIEVSPEMAYGPRINELEVTLERANIPGDVKIEVGQKVRVGPDEEHKTDFTITEVSDKSVTLDANHPLAGQNLTFEIEVVGVG